MKGLTMKGELQTTYNGCNDNNFPPDAGVKLIEAVTKRNRGRESEFSPEKAIIILDCLEQGKQG
jgi:hypothetical protein